MARPLTKGPPITFRLPLDLHTVLEARAASRDETIHEYVLRNMIRALEPPTTINVQTDPGVSRQVNADTAQRPALTNLSKNPAYGPMPKKNAPKDP